MYDVTMIYFRAKWMQFNPLNAQLNPICHLLALLGVHHILHVSELRVKAISITYSGCVFVALGVQHAKACAIWSFVTSLALLFSLFVCLMQQLPQLVMAYFTRFLDHTERRTIFGRIPLDE
jgi:hypothetical protein